MKKKVLVATSGGVDSSISAFLLKKAGFDVVGITMCFGVKDEDDGKSRCCGVQAIEDAKRVCNKLNIPHYVLDFSKDLEKRIINNFIAEYFRGRTPNPCIDCNKYIKFGILLEKAISSGFDFLATGHYAKIQQNQGKFFLKKPKDKHKDQTYFLYLIKYNFLKFLLFPLADFSKEEVREIARKINLPVAEKPESQDICFIPHRDYRLFLSKMVTKAKPGLIVDLHGNVLGKHNGIFMYTIGQRKRLGLNSKFPLYVIFIDVNKNQIIVGEKKNLKTRGLIATDVNLLVDNFPQEVFAKIRYAHNEAKCKIFMLNDKFEIIFEEEQEAISPGQSVVLYHNDTVLGGGVIEGILH